MHASGPLRPALMAGLLLGLVGLAHLGAGEAPSARIPGTDQVRAQLDTVGFAISTADMQAVLTAAKAGEDSTVAARRHELHLTDGEPWIAAIMPHDDYLYAGPVDCHLLPGLKARHWILIGVCHACRKLGVRDRLIFEDFRGWRVAGEFMTIDRELRSSLLAGLDSSLVRVDDERHEAEHSLESLLPWLVAAAPAATFVPVLVPGMSWERMRELAGHLADVLAVLCRQKGWQPGRDLGILISADAVHYGCQGWGPTGGYHPFGCDAAGHAAAVAQDRTLAEATLAGPLSDDGLERFVRLVWDSSHPEYPYRITWCGLYSIPFGLATASRLQASLGLPPLEGYLLRYGDSFADGRLAASTEKLGVTAPRSLDHWVGYAAMGYVPARDSTSE